MNLKKIASILLVVTVFLSTGITSAVTYETEKSHGVIEETLRLINKKIEMEMTSDPNITAKRSDVQKRNTQIDVRLSELGAQKMSKADVLNFFSKTESPNDGKAIIDALYPSDSLNNSNPSVLSIPEPPMPPSTDKIQFYSIRERVQGTWVYSVIASPYPNANISSNTVSPMVNFKSKLPTLASTIQLYVDKAISKIPIVAWLPYEWFTNLLFSGTSTSQLDLYEARLITRTVHQFIFVENSMGQFAYYGSANCVHMNVEEIARRYQGSQLLTEAKNEYYLDTAPDYYNWPTVCVGNNLTGYNVFPKYSFIHGVEIKVAGNTAISTNILTASLPIHVAS